MLNSMPRCLQASGSGASDQTARTYDDSSSSALTKTSKGSSGTAISGGRAALAGPSFCFAASKRRPSRVRLAV